MFVCEVFSWQDVDGQAQRSCTLDAVARVVRGDDTDNLGVELAGFDMLAQVLKRCAAAGKRDSQSRRRMGWIAGARHGGTIATGERFEADNTYHASGAVADGHAASG